MARADSVVVFNEIMYHPLTNETQLEWVELQNQFSVDVDMSGWRIDGVEYTFPLGTIINPRSTNMFVKDKTAFSAAYGSSIPVFAEFPGTLDPAGEKIALVKPGATPAQDVQVDALRYEPRSPWPTNGLGTGMALQVIDPTQDNSRPSNWGEPQGWRWSSSPPASRMVPSGGCWSRASLGCSPTIFWMVDSTVLAVSKTFASIWPRSILSSSVLTVISRTPLM